MEVENNTQELRETFEKLEEAGVSWNKYLALTTAIIAVVAAVVSLQAGNYANEALVQKNDAVLNQNKASDQYSYYQAKGIKKNIAAGFARQLNNDEKMLKESERYGSEQEAIKKTAENFEKKVEEANLNSEHLFEKHHLAAIGVTFFQIAIALAAMSALLKRKLFWLFSGVLSVGGVVFFIMSIVK